MILETVVVGSLQVNCYILAEADNSQALIIDPGDDENKIRQAINRHGLKPAFIINTHAHYDHIGCDNKFDLPVYVHRLDAKLLRSPELNLSNFLMSAYRVECEINILEDGQIIVLGGIQLEVIHTPGHTPGGICLLMKKPQDKILFSGDTLFYQSVGRTDFPGASESELLDSIKKKLLHLADDTVIYPGHGPSSTIGNEKKHNPFLKS